MYIHVIHSLTDAHTNTVIHAHMYTHSFTYISTHTYTCILTYVYTHMLPKRASLSSLSKRTSKILIEKDFIIK